MIDSRAHRPLTHLSIWGPFVLTTLLTLAVDHMGSHLPAYYWLLSVLGLFSLAFGIRMIWLTRGRAWVCAVVVAGLVIGQLWFIQFVAFVLFYSFQPFAP